MRTAPYINTSAGRPHHDAGQIIERTQPVREKPTGLSDILTGQPGVVTDVTGLTQDNLDQIAIPVPPAPRALTAGPTRLALTGGSPKVELTSGGDGGSGKEPPAAGPGFQEPDEPGNSDGTPKARFVVDSNGQVTDTQNPVGSEGLNLLQRMLINGAFGGAGSTINGLLNHDLNLKSVLVGFVAGSVGGIPDTTALNGYGPVAGGALSGAANSLGQQALQGHGYSPLNLLGEAALGGAVGGAAPVDLPSVSDLWQSVYSGGVGLVVTVFDPVSIATESKDGQ